MRFISLLAMSMATIAAFAVLPPEEPTQHWLDRSAKFHEEGVKPTDIVFLGNSLTEGGDWVALTGNTNAVNRGIIGDTAGGIATRLSDITSGHPAKIFLLCGANDISHDLTADSIATAVLEIVDTIHRDSPETQVYLQSLLPFNNNFKRYKRLFGKEDMVPQINALLSAQAPAHNAKWIELYSYFTDPQGNLASYLTGDGLHLNKAGYAIWGAIIKRYANE